MFKKLPTVDHAMTKRQNSDDLILIVDLLIYNSS